MLVAAHKAGRAFSKAYVGYVHALAHALGGKYNVPHGLANAVILPIPSCPSVFFGLAISAPTPFAQSIDRKRRSDSSAVY